MKVIFIKDLKGQGRKGEVKEVKDGYGMNFLIKNGYAIKATDGSINRLNKENAEHALEENLLIKDKKSEKEKLAKETLVFKMKTGKDGRVFGQVSTKQIKEELDKLGYKVDKKTIHVDHPIDTIGTHIVTITLHKQVTAELKVKVEQL